jgi:alpha-tubulin suppressor-like RCC1 family protein
VLSDGTIKCWGSNDKGQLGSGSGAMTSATPVKVSGINSALQVTVGYAHACAVLSDGTARCWGDNTTGQLGNNSTSGSSTPVQVSGITTAIAISAGSQTAQVSDYSAHTCAVLSDGTVKCWGWNYFCQLGNGQRTCGGNCGCNTSHVPVSVNGVTSAVAVAMSGADSCALLRDAGVYCWGDDNQGEISGSMTVSVPTVMLAPSPTGDSFMVLDPTGTIRGWGHDYDGQLGDGTTGADKSTAVTVMGVTNAVAMAVEGVTNDRPPGHGCAVLSDHHVRCWGDNAYGQLGNGSTNNSLSPVAVTGITSATAIALGSGIQSIGTSYGFSCALLAAGTVQCWGYGGEGQLGPDGGTSSTVPVSVVGLP